MYIRTHTYQKTNRKMNCSSSQPTNYFLFLCQFSFTRVVLKEPHKVILKNRVKHFANIYSVMEGMPVRDLLYSLLNLISLVN